MTSPLIVDIWIIMLIILLISIFLVCCVCLIGFCCRRMNSSRKHYWKSPFPSSNGKRLTARGNLELIPFAEINNLPVRVISDEASLEGSGSTISESYQDKPLAIDLDERQFHKKVKNTNRLPAHGVEATSEKN